MEDMMFLLLSVVWCNTFYQRECSGFAIMGFTQQQFIRRFARIISKGLSKRVQRILLFVHVVGVRYVLYDRGMVNY